MKVYEVSYKLKRLHKKAKHKLAKKIDSSLNPLVKINSIEHCIDLKDHPNILAYSIDAPSSSHSNNIQLIHLSGWLLGRKERALSMEVCLNGQVIKLLPLQYNREDVLKAFPGSSFTQHCGFSANIGTVGFPEKFQITIRAVLKNADGGQRKRVVIAIIKGDRRPLMISNYSPKRSPLMLTSMPRSGTTWMMKMLSSIPNIITHTDYPFEMRVGSYWIHAFKILVDPADFTRSTIPDNFESNVEMIGHNPYYDPHYYFGRKHMEQLHSQHIIKNTAECCMKNVDAFYDAVELDEGKSNTHYFLEKQMPSHIQNIYRELYPASKEIVLVRDLRDVICSAMHFNHKRKTKEFGRSLVNSDKEWIENMRSNLFERILITIRNREKDILLLRYEDMVCNPELIIDQAAKYLDSPLTQQEVNAVTRQCSSDKNIIGRHQTSKDTLDSISRWKRDMDNDIRDICEEVLGDALLELGYMH